MTEAPQGTLPAAGADTPPADQQKVDIKFHIGKGINLPEGSLPAGWTPAVDPSVDLRINTFRSLGVGEDVLEQVRAGKPVSEQEYTLAQHKKTSLMQDKAWVAKFLDGDQDARRTMAMISIILGSKIKEEKANG
jgi:hypothetical protein